VFLKMAGLGSPDGSVERLLWRKPTLGMEFSEAIVDPKET